MTFSAWRDQIFQRAEAGEPRQALALLASPPPGLSPVQRGAASFWAACLHAGLGEVEEALRALEGVEARGDWLAPARLRHDADLDALRNEERFVRLLARWEARRVEEQARTRPQLRVFGAPARPALIALHENLSSADATQTLHSDLLAQGERVALAQSGQLGGLGSYVWNDAAQADREARAWAAELGGRPLWAGFSAGAQVATRVVLTGQVPARGLLLVIPSLSAEPGWWPPALPALPVALLLGEHDPLRSAALDFAARLREAGVPTRVWTFPGGHAVPPGWPSLRDEARRWLEGYEQG
ncbi:hypothetical protein SAMN04488058_101515 [Deinococcus reticulitermitis]|uniref:Alpha/beta hydrolase family protein n=1 Tax=Deinococcus reticulitermitis TaxID=856736 RepID=A0A1H6THI4_9DEIO|nr:hypothetical protein [Deinococcus reticulitermitis]SEI75242.1 hypothetical protein SAMN04488058_101515 [Deinococcus reticulitermitis]